MDDNVDLSGIWNQNVSSRKATGLICYYFLHEVLSTRQIAYSDWKTKNIAKVYAIILPETTHSKKRPFIPHYGTMNNTMIGNFVWLMILLCLNQLRVYVVFFSLYLFLNGRMNV